jgi:hypothetical protein
MDEGPLGRAVGVCPIAPQRVQERDKLGMVVVVEPGELGPPGRSCPRFLDDAERVRHLTPRV